MANKSTRNDIDDSAVAIAATLTGKNRGSAATAVTTASAYKGSDTNLLENIITAAGVTVSFQGNDDVKRAAAVTAVAALSTLP